MMICGMSWSLVRRAAADGKETRNGPGLTSRPAMCKFGFLFWRF